MGAVLDSALFAVGVDEHKVADVGVWDHIQGVVGPLHRQLNHMVEVELQGHVHVHGFGRRKQRVIFLVSIQL